MEMYGAGLRGYRQRRKLLRGKQLLQQRPELTDRRLLRHFR